MDMTKHMLIFFFMYMLVDKEKVEVVIKWR
jgi:hypothetical protein